MEDVAHERGSSTPTLEYTTVRFLRRPRQIVRDDKRVYLILNVATYGLFLAGFGLGLLFPELSAAQAAGLEENGTGDLVRSIFATPWLFALIILAVNVFKLSLATIALPSMIVPFAGLPLFGFWAVTTGIVLVPSETTGWLLLIPHSLTVVIELQAYILVALGAYRLGVSWLRPRSVGATNRRQGYVRGLKQLGWLAVPAFLLLVVGAVWEAFSLLGFSAVIAGAS